MIYLNQGDVFLHSKLVDCDNHPLVCEVINIDGDMVEWRRADCSWAKSHSFFFRDEISKYVLKLLNK